MPQTHPRLILGSDSLAVDCAGAQVILGTAHWLGIREVDAAGRFPATQMQLSEMTLGETKAISKGVAVNTKIVSWMSADTTSLKGDNIRGSLLCSRENLQLEGGQRINVLLCHAPDDNTPIKEQASALHELHQQGVFDKLGVCSWPLGTLINFIDICENKGYVKPSVYQGHYNVLQRGRETLMPTLRKHGIRFDAHSTLADGFLSGSLTTGNVEGTRFGKEGETLMERSMCAALKQMYDKPEMHEAMRFLDEVLVPINKPKQEWLDNPLRYLNELKKPQVTKVELALRWVCYHSMLTPEDGVILGVSKPQQLSANVAAIEKGPLPDDLLAAVEMAWKISSVTNKKSTANRARAACESRAGSSS
ncbi:hypothetical protein PG985_011153 [Apiospora marii]|uniref:NADP-dependent oxidoreductase domain-containing protein n=1 Tax=Apiospora marii TaxID=335849 RepID=A0ABR1SSX0_9PEZI